MKLIDADTLKARLAFSNNTGDILVSDMRKVFEVIDSLQSFKCMTNGEVIMAVFPETSVYVHGGTYSVNNEYNFNSTWWNAPYKGGEQNEQS